jgi:hypothetical protein
MNNQEEEDIVDLEEFAKDGKLPPKAKAYRIRVDTKQIVVEVSHMTAGEILEKAGKIPAKNYKIYQQIKGETKLLDHTQDVDFTTPGIERFKTIPIDQTDGLVSPPRRLFLLPEQDRLFLDAKHPAWESVKEGDGKILIVPRYDLPEGYDVAQADVALRIDPKYPMVQIDMVYFSPALARKDGRPLRYVSEANFDSRKWQQWSRHRTEANPWREELDSVETHLLLVDHWLLVELKR